MAVGFTTSADIINRGLQHVGARRILTLTDTSKNASESAFLYDKVRAAELRRNVWTFACRRAILRPATTTTQKLLPANWSAGTAAPGAVVVSVDQGGWWIATQTTTASPADGGAWTRYAGPVIGDIWSNAALYFPGDVVFKASPVTTAYTCIQENTNQDPATQSAYWTPWTATGTLLGSFSPVRYNALTTGNTRSLFVLPYNYLRLAPQDLKASGVSRLAVTAGQRYTDWEIEGQYLLSGTATAFLFRFVANVTDVAGLMDDMFCEGLGARIAMELCEPLTQAPDKLTACEAIYERYISEARMAAAIEMGSTEAPENPDEPQAAPAGVPARGRAAG